MFNVWGGSKGYDTKRRKQDVVTLQRRCTRPSHPSLDQRKNGLNSQKGAKLNDKK